MFNHVASLFVAINEIDTNKDFKVSVFVSSGTQSHLECLQLFWPNVHQHPLVLLKGMKFSDLQFVRER